MVLFIASNPSSKANLNAEPMCISTSSGKVFRKWIGKMNIDNYNVENIYPHSTVNNAPLRKSDITDHRIGELYNISKTFTKIIALGSFASSILTSMNINHFKLPHPSPRNRQLNDKEFIKDKLNRCMQYLCD